MSEREEQAGDGETAVCHVCRQEFATQEELLTHLDDRHEGELLT